MESANDKIGSFIQIINTKEELLEVSTRDYDRLKHKLTVAEKESNKLETKINSIERILEVEKLDLKDQIKIYIQQIDSEKKAREDWIKRYETEYKSNLETTSEVMLLRTSVKELTHKNKNSLIELALIKREFNKVTRNYEEKNLNLMNTLKELGINSINSLTNLFRCNKREIGINKRSSLTC